MQLKFAFAIVLSASFAFAQQPEQRRIVRPINNASAVRLEGTMSPRARAGVDRGPVAATMPLERMTVVFSRSAAQQADLDQLLAEQQDPASANYHKWLTPEEFGDRFGLAQADVDTVSAWLTAQGFKVEEVARGRDWITFSGIAAQVEAAFRAPIHNYLVNGVTHYAASADVAVPDAFSGVITGVTGLHNFAPRPLNVKPRPRVTSSITGNHFVVPGDFGTIYNLPDYVNGIFQPGIDGTGQTIAVVGQSDLSTDSNPGRTGTPGAVVNGQQQQYDIVTFRTLAGLPPVNLTVVNGSDPGIVSGDVDEANLDLEWAGAAAPNADLIYYIENSNSGGAFQSLVDAVNADKAQVISVSYGTCEATVDSSTQSLLTNAGQKANTQGQAIVVAAGDNGAADCDTSLPATMGLSVDFPGSMPYSTSVGGTTLTGDTTNPTVPSQPTQYWAGSTTDTVASAFSYIPETAWNDSSGQTTGSPTATGGGASVIFPAQSWQTGPGVPNPSKARYVPDISLNASASHDFTVICSQSSCVNGYRNTDTTFDVIGGTSIGTPQFAGILALTNQALMNAGKATLGNPDAALYQIASNTYPLVTPTSWAFNDITTGDNIVACAAPTTANPDTGCPANGGSMGYSAGVGYDQVTGLGSVDATALIDAINGTPNAHFLVLPVSRYETIVPSGNAVVALTVTPKEGFTGTVALMCATASLTGATCSFDNPSVAAGGSANLTIQVGSSQSSQSGTVTVTGTSGSTTNSVVVNVAINAPDFSITSGNSTETVSSGGSTNDTITVTPIQGFTSSVTLSCTQVTGTGLSCSTSPTAVTPGTPSTLTVSATSSATSGSVILTATGGGQTHSLTIPVTVNAVAPSFTMTVASPAVAIPSGGVITDNLTVAAVGGFNSDVALSCSVPSSLGTTTCTIGPPSTITGGSGSVLVTLRGAVLSRDVRPPLPFQHRGMGIYASYVFSLGFVFLAAPATASRRKRDALTRLSRVKKVLLTLLALGLLLGALSCGGGSSGGGGGGGVTPITGNVTITGTGGGMTQTATINVTVN